MIPSLLICNDDYIQWISWPEQEHTTHATRKKVLGVDHPDTMTSMANLASTYRNLGRWVEAVVLEVQVIETSKRILGEEHPDTLASMVNLASTYRNQGWRKGPTALEHAQAS
jgi:hypothetical protein